jgi:hypothetical protein
VANGTTSPSQTLTVRNTGTANVTGITATFGGGTPQPYSRPAGAAGGTCATATPLTPGGTCTINVVFAPTGTTTTTYNRTVTITSNVTVTGSPVALSGTGGPPAPAASVSPSPLAFGNWASGTTSAPLNLTVTNTGNTNLAGGTFTFGGGSTQYSLVTTGTFPSNAPSCGTSGTGTLALGASCTLKVAFTPTAAGAQNRTLTVAYTGATVTPTPVSLTGTGVAARSTMTVTPSPLTITLPTGNVTGTGTVTLTNTAGAGGAQVAVSSAAVSGGSISTYVFTADSNACTGATLAPGASCSVVVRFTNVGSARGTNRTGTVTFTDNGAPASGTQTGNLVGFATP